MLWLNDLEDEADTLKNREEEEEYEINSMMPQTRTSHNANPIRDSEKVQPYTKQVDDVLNGQEKQRGLSAVDGRRQSTCEGSRNKRFGWRT